MDIYVHGTQRVKYTSFAIFDTLSYIFCSLSLFCFLTLFHNYNKLETASENKNPELPKHISRSSFSGFFLKKGARQTWKTVITVKVKKKLIGVALLFGHFLVDLLKI